MKFLLLAALVGCCFCSPASAGEPVYYELHEDILIDPLHLPNGISKLEVTYIHHEYAIHIWQAYAEHILLASSETAFLRNAIRRAGDQAEQLQLLGLAAEFRIAFAELKNTRTHSLVILGDNAVCNESFLEEKHREVYRLEMDEKDVKRKQALLELRELIDRATLFYIRLGRTKSQAYILREMFCRGHWTECEIESVKILRDTTCKSHGKYLLTWFPALKAATEKWSVEKAISLGGINDLDSEACSLWLEEMKQIFIDDAGQEWVDEVYSNPDLRIMLWLQAARTMRCGALSYVGTQPGLSGNEKRDMLKGKAPFVQENLLALRRALSNLAIYCCEPVYVYAEPVLREVPKPRVEVIPSPVEIPSGCCGQVNQNRKGVYSLPSWCQ